MSTVRVVWLGGMRFEGKGSGGHAVKLHNNPEEEAVTPVEMLLEALGGCTGMDVVSLLEKMRVPFTRLEVEVSGARRREHPRSFTSIEVVYRTDAGDEAKLTKAVTLSLERYCSVRASIRPDCKLSWRIERV